GQSKHGSWSTERGQLGGQCIEITIDQVVPPDRYGEIAIAAVMRAERNVDICCTGRGRRFVAVRHGLSISRLAGLSGAAPNRGGAMRLAGKVALVTGASAAIGRATALSLAQEGADVALNYLTWPEGADELAAQIRALGRKPLLCPVDVSDQTAVEA